MGWLRSSGVRVAWLVYLALACQYVLTFGHIHFGNVGVISAELAISDDSSGAPSSPTQKKPTGLAQDFCAVCNNIRLANALLLPVSSAIFPPISFIQNLRWSFGAIVLPLRDHFHFNARGPPRLNQ
jgi:hypothetical protein